MNSIRVRLSIAFIFCLSLSTNIVFFISQYSHLGFPLSSSSSSTKTTPTKLVGIESMSNNYEHTTFLTNPSSDNVSATIATNIDINQTEKRILPPNFSIHILGERHSGTNWIEREMEKCFGHAIQISDIVFRFKHWWQSPSVLDTNANRFQGRPSRPEGPPDEETYGIVIALFRNPYDWLEAMRREPHHAVNHWNIERNIPLPWEDFLARPWTMDRLKYKNLFKEDYETLVSVSSRIQQDLIGNHSRDNSNSSSVVPKDQVVLPPHDSRLRPYLRNTTCYLDFFWYDIVPCSRQDRVRSEAIVPFAGAIYELQRDGSGKPFDNILQLRREKILHFYSQVSNFTSIQYYLAHRYEDIYAYGTSLLIQQIEAILRPYQIKAKCSPTRRRKYYHKVFPNGMIDHINANLDWDVEHLIGYNQITAAKITDENKEYHQLLSFLKNKKRPTRVK